MNVSFDLLHLFSYVALHRGIHAAARQNPWGLSASAISKSMTQLEAELGVKLFGRMPFVLYSEGALILKQLVPLYEVLEETTARNGKLRGVRLRVGASTYVIQHYVLPLVTALWRRHPDLQLDFYAGCREETAARVERNELDVALLTVDRPPPRGKWQPLLERPVVVFAPEAHAAKTGWEAVASSTRLVLPPRREAATLRFDAAQKARALKRTGALYASETAEVVLHVRLGTAVGVGVGVHSLTSLPGIRTLPLDGVPPVTVGAVWRKECRELRTLLEAVAQTADRIKEFELPPRKRDGAASCSK